MNRLLLLFSVLFIFFRLLTIDLLTLYFSSMQRGFWHHFFCTDITIQFSIKLPRFSLSLILFSRCIVEQLYIQLKFEISFMQKEKKYEIPHHKHKTGYEVKTKWTQTNTNVCINWINSGTNSQYGIQMQFKANKRDKILSTFDWICSFVNFHWISSAFSVSLVPPLWCSSLSVSFFSLFVCIENLHFNLK